MRCKTVVILGEDQQITIDGNIVIEDCVGVEVEEEITEVVDDTVVYCYTIKKKGEK